MQLKHRPMIVHVHCNSLGGLGVQDSKRALHFDLSILTRAQKRPYDPLLLFISPKIVIKDRKERDGVDRD